ncbi:MAG TPA: hypothetical protein VF297_08050 [Pyrinomonadaceae bacterium]
MAYNEQSISLRFVQKFGPELERAVTAALNWPEGRGRVVYFHNDQLTLKYDLQVDAFYPNAAEPQIFVSVTYCKPDKPGHSNENKLQLKLGELMLLKARFPEIRSVLVIGGNQGTWLPYVLKAFQFFFDRTIFAWEDGFDAAIEEVRTSPFGVQRKHAEIWQRLASEWTAVPLWEGEPIDSSMRESMWELISETGCEGELPEDISNDIFRHCMQAAFDRHKSSRGRSGKEWSNYVNEDWEALWQSRSYVNPGEAAIQLLLEKAGLAYEGGLAKDVPVPSLIHHLGGREVDNTKVSEDFVLYSRALDRPVFIQSKASGGGKEGHGKNIQNRAKEQLARSLFYRGGLDEQGNIIIRPKDYYWIGLLDGNWGVTKKAPLKYLHMLQWAGYDMLLPTDSLVNDDMSLSDVNTNMLIQRLLELDCLTDQVEFERRWKTWRAQRMLQRQGSA